MGTLPFQPLAQGQSINVTASRLTPAQQVLNVLSDVAYYDGPQGHLLIFKGGVNYRMFIKARYQVAVQAGQAAGDYLVDLGAAGLDMVQSTRAQPALPTSVNAGQGAAGTSTHPDVLAYTSVDGGATWQLAFVRAVDFGANKVTLTVPANPTHIAVYFLPGDGEFAIRITRAAGSDVAATNMGNGALRSVHETDQVNISSAPVLGEAGREYPLPPQFRLSLAVRSKASVVFDQYAMHELTLPTTDTPIRVLDAGRLNAEAEVKLRGGSL